jgi:hypothetical protein
MSIIRLALLLLALISCRTAPAAPVAPAETRLFRFQTDEFWLNLHDFLYVLGRSARGLPDARREAVANAPRDAAEALVGASDSERAEWSAAVDTYAATIASHDPVFDEDLWTIIATLARARDSAAPPAMPIAPTLLAVAPLYRRLWWPAHHEANVRWRDDAQRNVDRYGGAVLAYIERAYGMRWPPAGFPVHVSAYSNWAGAYSTGDDLLVISSLVPGKRGLRSLETVFHEGMHQWDDAVAALLEARARRLGVSVPRDLSHAMIFFTSGEAVRAVVDSTYVPNAQARGVWGRGLESYRQALEVAWRPHLAGRVGRDAAIDSLLVRLRER